MITPKVRHMIRIAKRLAAATGYLELGMTQHALDTLEGLSDLGPFEGPVELLRGEALRIQHRYADAEKSLKIAARKFPSPEDRTAWLALSNCYRQAGDVDGAVRMLARARGAHPPKKKRKSP